MMSLSVRHMSFSFGDVQVLKDISFDVAPGEFVGIMGPNGSGKTTLLRCVTKFLPSEYGTMLVGSRFINDLTPAEMAKTFAVVPQTSATDFPFTVHDIVMMGRIPHIGSRLSGESKRDVEVVRQAMARTNTTQFATRVFSELSGGERQRVIIARAIAQKPKVLLLDEPTVFLDISGQLEIMDLLKRLNREEGITTIAVLHDVNLAARYCDRIALLSQGRLEAMGAPKEVLSPETIQSVYGVDVSVRKDPLTQSIYIMPHSAAVAIHKHGTRVHLLCGGGAGGVFMKSLHDSGYSVTAGVLNVLDSDYENAKDMHIPVVAEAPFAPISPENHAENLTLIDESVAVVVSPFPVGPGNLRNLEAATHALRTGKRVLLVRPAETQAVDFVDGKADAIITNLISSGATVVADVSELLSRLAPRGG